MLATQYVIILLQITFICFDKVVLMNSYTVLKTILPKKERITVGHR